jgi:L-threonylcarbamoyladenylate synthase
MCRKRESKVLRVNAQTPGQRAIEEAVSVLRTGGLVVLPTDTVYGLCCNALIESAVAEVYEAKGRPASMPLIIFLPDAQAMDAYAAEVPDLARQAAAKWWPGPLTIILKRRESVPGFAVAGGDTVGLRVPAHPVALAVLKAADFPVASTSANLSSRPSPVQAPGGADLCAQPDVILDAGPCPLGRESTVVDFSQTPAVLLREGAVPLADLHAALGPASILSP